VKKVSFIVTRVPGAVDEEMAKELENLKIEPIAFIPLDSGIQRFDLEQRSLLEMPDSSDAVRAVRKLMDIILAPATAGSLK
jgi:CO dehydrogenase nickel-insertion accessory protein CooC1